MNSFVCALRGIGYTIRTERHMRVHLVFTYYVIVAGLILHLRAVEWMAALLCIGMVTALECVNTSLERLCDEVHPEHSEGIRNVKDIAAGAVLCAAAASAVVGCLLFLNRTSLAVMGEFFEQNTVLSVLLILTLIPLIFFVRGGKREEK
ncbi:MAG: diacylglycerol kinase family protein [Oscillospiraceae bacterium]|jgi:diacylglycerol kinase